MQQKFFDPKTGRERQPSFDGEKKQAPKQQAAAPKKAAPKPAAAPPPQQGLLEQLIKAITSIMTEPSGSSQPQMQHEDAERANIQRRGAPLNPNAAAERVDQYDGKAQATAAKGAAGIQSKGPGAPPIQPPKGGMGTPPMQPPKAAPKPPQGQPAPPIMPPTMQPPSPLPPSMPPQPQPPLPPAPKAGPMPPMMPPTTGFVDAGYGTGPLNDQGFQRAFPDKPAFDGKRPRFQSKAYQKIR